MRNLSRLTATLIALTLSASVLAESQPDSSVKAMAQSSLLGIQLAAKQDFKKGALRQEQFDCFQSTPPSELYPIFTQFMQEQFSPYEQQEADAFFSSPVGRKYTKQGLAQVYARVGERPPEPPPSFTESEYKQLESFAATGAGQKLVMKQLVQSPAIQQALGAKLKQLIEKCRSQ